MCDSPYRSNTFPSIIVTFCLYFRVPCHIVHLSSASALPMIRKAREEGVPLTIETTHHYLSLQAENVPDGATQFKCCPPVRDGRNQVSIAAYSTGSLVTFTRASFQKQEKNKLGKRGQLVTIY